MHNNKQTSVLTKNNISILYTSRTRTLMQLVPNKFNILNKLNEFYVMP